MRFSTLAMLAGVAACARSSSSQISNAAAAARAASPESMLTRAIVRSGGERALIRARALVWDGDAVVHAGGRTVRISGTWAVQPPDTAVVATFDVTRGAGTTRALVVAAPRGWLVSGNEFTPMPPAMLANERDEFYLYQVMRLVSLRGETVRLTEVAPDTLGQPGFRVEQPGRPPVELHVDSTGRLAHLRTEVRDPTGGSVARQDLWLGGSIEAGGVQWPRTIRIDMNGEVYFELTLRTLRVQDRVDDARTTGGARDGH